MENILDSKVTFVTNLGTIKPYQIVGISTSFDVSANFVHDCGTEEGLLFVISRINGTHFNYRGTEYLLLVTNGFGNLVFPSAL